MPRSKWRIESYLTREQMEKLATPRLLAFRKSLLSLPEWRRFDQERFLAEYDRALAESKEILDSREHVRKRKRT